MATQSTRVLGRFPFDGCIYHILLPRCLKDESVGETVKVSGTCNYRWKF